jgi:hypothetical protein
MLRLELTVTGGKFEVSKYDLQNISSDPLIPKKLYYNVLNTTTDFSGGFGFMQITYQRKVSFENIGINDTKKDVIGGKLYDLKNISTNQLGQLFQTRLLTTIYQNETRDIGEQKTEMPMFMLQNTMTEFNKVVQFIPFFKSGDNHMHSGHEGQKIHLTLELYGEE